MAAMTARGRTEVVMRKIETALLDGTRPARACRRSAMLAQEYGVARNTVREATSGVTRGLLGAGAARAST